MREPHLVLRAFTNDRSVRYLPDWFPGTDFKQVAKEITTTMRDHSGKPWEVVKHQMAKGTYDSSFVSRLHEQAGGELTGEDAEVAKWAANGLYGGGADTVSPTNTVNGCITNTSRLSHLSWRSFYS